MKQRLYRQWLPTAFLLANLSLYAAYFVHLQADFPNGSPWNDFAKYTDEGWYAGAALHHVQTGRWYITDGFNPAVALPAWPALLAGWFALVGPGIVAARVLTLLLFGGSLLLLYALLRPTAGQLVATATVTLALINPYSFSFNRLALLEPMVVFLFLLGLWVATASPPRDSGMHRIGWNALCRAAAVGVLITTAILTKTTALALAPALLYQVGVTSAGSLPLADCNDNRRLYCKASTRYQVLVLPLLALVVSAALWSCYLLVVVRTHHLSDYHHLFAINAGKAHLRILLLVMATALRHTLWIDRMLLPVTGVSLAASLLVLRELWRIPLFVSSVLALVGALGLIGWHTWFQPRYYLVCVFPATIILALALRALRDRLSVRSSPWRIAHRILLAAFVVTVATMLPQTGHYLLHPQYTMRNAAGSIAAIMRADSRHAPVLLAGSADTIAMFTGLRSTNPEWPIGGLAALLRREQPGWFAAYLPREARLVDEMRTHDSLSPVAEYQVFDEPEHRRLVLYRLDPRSAK